MTIQKLYRSLLALGLVAIWVQILMVAFGVRHSLLVVALYSCGVLLVVASATIFIRSALSAPQEGDAP